MWRAACKDCGPVWHFTTNLCRDVWNTFKPTGNKQPSNQSLPSAPILNVLLVLVSIHSVHRSSTELTHPKPEIGRSSRSQSHMSVSLRRYHSEEVLSRGQTRSRSHGSCPDPFARARGVPAVGWGWALLPWTLRRNCWCPLFLRWREGREEGAYGGEEPPSPCSEAKHT